MAAASWGTWGTPGGSYPFEVILILVLVLARGWVVLLLDTGGGKDGMHLSLEFALLMARNEIEVFALRQYYTKCMMPLDRDVHKEQALAWTRLRMAYAAQTGFAVATQFQALALVRQAWMHGATEHFIKNSWRHCGISPWNPNEILVNQAASLFKARVREAADFDFQDSSSKAILKLPNTMMERKLPCTSCKAPVLDRFRYCPECGNANGNFQAESHAVMREGRRSGHKRLRPSQFDIGEFVKSNFAGLKGLKAITEEGAKAIADDSSSSASSSSEDSDKEEAAKVPEPKALEDAKVPEPKAKEPAKVPEPKVKYDPPTFIPSQLKTQAGQKKAWGAVLADVSDAKNKQAFISWMPEFVKDNIVGIAKHYPKNTAAAVIIKDLVDKVVKKTPEQRYNWYSKRIHIMMEDIDKKAAHPIK